MNISVSTRRRYIGCVPIFDKKLEHMKQLILTTYLEIDYNPEDHTLSTDRELLSIQTGRKMEKGIHIFTDVIYDDDGKPIVPDKTQWSTDWLAALDEAITENEKWFKDDGPDFITSHRAPLLLYMA